MIPTQERLVAEFEKMDLELVLPPKNARTMIATMVAKPDLRAQITEAQKKDPFLIKLDKKIRDGTTKEFHRNDEREILRGKRLCVPEDDNLRREIL